MAGLLLSRKLEAGCNEDIVVYCFLNNHKPQVIISQSQADMYMSLFNCRTKPAVYMNGDSMIFKTW